jgi:glyoxylase I family protein
MQLNAVHHVAVVTANFAQMKQFYTEVLGLEVVGKFVGKDIIFLKTGPLTIELVSRPEHVAGTSGGWNHFAFEVEDIDATAAELTAKGVVFHIPPFNFPDNHAVRIGFFKDPDGNPIELVQPLKGRYPQDK